MTTKQHAFKYARLWGGTVTKIFDDMSRHVGYHCFKKELSENDNTYSIEERNFYFLTPFYL